MTDVERISNHALKSDALMTQYGFSRPMITAMRRRLVEEQGWTVGTDLENQVALMLSSFNRNRPLQRAEQQYRIGKYRVDFAWPKEKIVLEADGWHHRSPAGAARDRERDSWLRSQGWLVFRVDDEHGTDLLEHQVMRVSRFVRSEDR